MIFMADEPDRKEAEAPGVRVWERRLRALSRRVAGQLLRLLERFHSQLETCGQAW